MDSLAAKIGVDPLELRRRNFIATDKYPYEAYSGLDVRLGQPRRRGDEGRRDARLRRAAGPPGHAERRGRDQAARHRRHVVLRDVRAGAVAGAGLAQLLGRRLGGRHGAGAADGEGAGRHRQRAARPGARDVVVDDRRREDGHQPRRRRRAALRHRDRPARARHLRLALAAGRRRRDRDGVRQGHRQGQADRRPPARSVGRRPRVRGRRVLGQGLARQGDAAGGDRLRGVHRPQPARRAGAQPRSAGHLRPAELLVAVRHPHVRRRGRHRDRPGRAC